MNRKNKQWIAFLLIGVMAGAGVYWFRRRQAAKRLDIPAWPRVLAKRHSFAQANRSMDATRRVYADLLADYPLPKNPALRWHFIRQILPGLALYRVLLSEHRGDKQAALAEIDELFRAWTEERNRVILAPMRVLPVSFGWFKWAAGLQMKLFPAEGWDFQPVENSDTRLAFNITRCFYLNTLTALGAPELTAAFCKTDDVMAERFPPSVQFVRPHTLGRGDALCDFQYCRVEPSMSKQIAPFDSHHN